MGLFIIPERNFMEFDGLIKELYAQRNFGPAQKVIWIGPEGDGSPTHYPNM